MGWFTFCCISSSVILVLILDNLVASTNGKQISEDCFYENGELIVQLHLPNTPMNVTCNDQNCPCDGSKGYKGCLGCCCQPRKVEEKGLFLFYGITFLFVIVFIFCKF